MIRWRFGGLEHAAFHALLAGCRAASARARSVQRGYLPQICRRGGCGQGSRAAVRPVRVVAVRREVHRDERVRRASPRPVDLARRAGPVPAQRNLGAAPVLALSGDHPGVQPVLRHPALPDADRLPGLGVRLASGRLSADSHARRAVHRGEPAGAADPGRAAEAAGRHRPGGHRVQVRAVGVHLGSRGAGSRPVLGDAVGARGLGADRGDRGHHRVPVALAVAGRPLPGADHAGRGGDGEPLLVRRNRRRDPGGAGGADRETCAADTVREQTSVGS
jgi:hypothetical protein